MSNIAEDKYQSEQMRQLLAAVGSTGGEDVEKPEVSDYDWARPHRFNSDQKAALKDFFDKVGDEAADRFRSLFGAGRTVLATSPVELSADSLLASESEDAGNRYYVAFGDDPAMPCGFLEIPPATATDWIVQLLGDTQDKGDTDRMLTPLEQSLLLDAAAALVGAFIDSCDGCNFKPASAVVWDRLPMELEGTEEFCRITFQVQKPDSQSQSEVNLIMLSNEIEPLTGNIRKNAEKLTSEQTRQALLQHLQDIDVGIEARLGTASLTFGQIMSLQPEDVILLDRRVNEPVEIIFEAKELFFGLPAKSDGNYAVAVTQRISDGPQ